MIFNVKGHIELIRNGLLPLYSQGTLYHPMPGVLSTRIVKTQSRRLNRGIYQVGKDYAVQHKRGVKAEQDIRIVMDTIWIERYAQYLCCYISKEDAWSEGGYESPIEFEVIFRKAYPKWDGARWAFKFHVIAVQ